jgi:hypothetical protein
MCVWCCAGLPVLDRTVHANGGNERKTSEMAGVAPGHPTTVTGDRRAPHLGADKAWTAWVCVGSGGHVSTQVDTTRPATVSELICLNSMVVIFGDAARPLHAVLLSSFSRDVMGHVGLT